MQLSNRFLSLVQQQLRSYQAEHELEKLVVYIAQARDGQVPSLESVGQWPIDERVLPPVEADPALRIPSPDRRWYPLQEGSSLLGVLRVDRLSSDKAWPIELDQRLQATATALAQ